MSKSRIYLLHYVYEFQDGHEDSVLLGVFSTRNQVELEMKKLEANALLMSHLVISESVLDRSSWAEGFVTVSHYSKI